MSNLQTTAPVTDNAAVVETPEQEGSILTGKPEAAVGTPPSATGAATKEPPGWMSQLPADLKSDEALAKFPNVWDMAKSYKELEGKLSKAVVPPSETATEEEKARYRKAIGVPEKSEDYKLEQVELPEGLTIDEAMQKQFLQTAHATGLNDAQVNAINQWYMKTIGEQIVAAQKVVKATEEETADYLRKKHGVGYNAEMSYMERGFNLIKTPRISVLLAKSGIGNDPEFIEKMISLGKRVKEHEFVDGSRGEHLETGKVGERSDEEIAAVVYPPKAGQ